MTHVLVVLNKKDTTQNVRKTAREDFQLLKVIVQRRTISYPILKKGGIRTPTPRTTKI